MSVKNIISSVVDTCKIINHITAYRIAKNYHFEQSWRFQNFQEADLLQGPMNKRTERKKKNIKLKKYSLLTFTYLLLIYYVYLIQFIKKK